MTLAHAIVASAATLSGAADDCSIQLRLIGTHAIPADAVVKGDAFGGISGIDYDERKRLWYFVSDDRGERSPPRFFTVKMRIDSGGVHGVDVLDSTRLPLAKERLDAETIRVGFGRDELIVGGEEDATRDRSPWLGRISLKGRWLGAYELPPLFATLARQNRSLEGISRAWSGKALWIAMESPLLPDGDVADTTHGADVRIALVSFQRKPSRQFAYPVDAALAHGPGESSDSGVSEILASGPHELLVLERSGVMEAADRFRFRARLYCATWSQATDVASFDSLSGHTYARMQKKLISDFTGTLDAPASNFEAMSFGPKLVNGHRTLVVASDNNFLAGVPTTLLFFEVTD